MSRVISVGRVVGGLALLGLAVAAPAAPVAGQAGGVEPDPEAEPIRIEEEKRFYDVTGGTDQEIWDSLVEHARREHDDLVFAWTRVATEYFSHMVRDAEGCRVVGATVRVKITVTLPRWTPPRDAPLALRQQWNRYELAIERHEDGHVRLARATARRLHDALVGLAARDCETLETAGNEIGARILAEGKAEQDRYDEQTGHGRTQGVRWVIDRRSGSG